MEQPEYLHVPEQGPTPGNVDNASPARENELHERQIGTGERAARTDETETRGAWIWH